LHLLLELTDISYMPLFFMKKIHYQKNRGGIIFKRGKSNVSSKLP
jgi:hypothetical protein